jgi:hypothetical protein
MGIMASERGGQVFATDERFVLSNKAEIDICTLHLQILH